MLSAAPEHLPSVLLAGAIQLSLESYSQAEQFLEQYKEHLKPYVNLGQGLYAPKSQYKELVQAINDTSRSLAKFEKKRNSNKDIIWKALRNHEAQYTDSSDTIEALKHYDITAEEINAEYDKYIKYCVRNDLI